MAALPPEVAKLIPKIKTFKSELSKSAKEDKNMVQHAAVVIQLTTKFEGILEKLKYAEKEIAEMKKLQGEVKAAKTKLPKEVQTKHNDFFVSMEKLNVAQLKDHK